MLLPKSMSLASRIQCRYASKLAHYTPASPVPKGPARGQLPPPLAEGELPTYHVSRTKSQELPVYHDVKNSNRKLTLIRKITGEVGVLKQELQEYIGLAEDRISVNTLTKHIVIKGWHKAHVKRFLEARRF